MDARLSGATDLAGFRADAVQLLAQQVPPEDVHWVIDEGYQDQFCDSQSPLASRPRNVARATTAIIPASFTRLCEFVVLHRDPERYALLYRLLWRLVHEPGLRNDPVDPDMLQAQHMAHAVRRDIHKMKANLRLRPIRDAQGQEWQLGSYEPAHHVVETVGAWMAKRLPASHWALFAPCRSVRCEDGLLLFGPGVPAAKTPLPGAPEADWLHCYQQVFASHDRPAAHA
ncbi:MAG: uracil-DNA glycosylase protein-like protein [Ramlibacter sp.]|nr:uracil-DNA glycosylase protein-like protein [Ramlibacter sp.]